jgi:NAD(P)-dependent dehydrogenase (short-subunit alcohol dehydrogenase family)
MNKLINKWALITGSTRGIGQQIALGLAAEGCNLIIHGREGSHAAKTLELIKPYNIKSIVVGGDLGIEADEKNIIKKIIDEIGYVDILYNNAALGGRWHKSCFDIKVEDWQELFRVNLFAIVRFCNAFVPIMVKRGWGRVINLTSGIIDTPQLAHYSVSKSAVNRFTQELACELRGTNVLANALDPGWVKTDLGGEQAEFEISTVLPGALLPALLDNNGPSGEIFRAQEYKISKS